VVEISAIVPIHNALPYALLALESIRSHSVEEIEIIPVCDRCEGSVIEVLKKFGFSPIEVDEGDYHRSAERGEEKANSEFIMICNSDMIFGSEWDIPIRREAQDRKSVVMSLHIQRYESLGWRAKLREPKTGIWTQPGLPSTISELNWALFTSLCNYLKAKYVGINISGWHIAQMVLPRSLFQSIGRFSKVKTDGKREKNMELAVKDRGFSTKVCLDSQVLHFAGISMHKKAGNDISGISEWWPFSFPD
jgi:GT2 family glycosyltransferase